MNELSNTTISSKELQKFINNDDTNYDLSKAIISPWAPQSLIIKWLLL